MPGMTTYALIQLAVGLSVILIGVTAIRLTGLNLPRSRTFTEFAKRIFWIYAPDIPRDKIRKNHLASLLVLVTAYIAVLVFNSIWRG